MKKNIACVCVCARLSACGFMSVHVCVHVCGCGSMFMLHACVHVCVRTLMCVCMCVRACACGNVHDRLSVRACVRVCARVCVFMCICASGFHQETVKIISINASPAVTPQTAD